MVKRKTFSETLTEADILADQFSTPWDAPTIPPFPFSFRNVEVLTFTYRTTQQAIAGLLPPPLEVTGDVVMVHIYRMNDTDYIGDYRESNVMVGARLPNANFPNKQHSGAYSPYLFLNSEVGVCHGREVHGQPKKLGSPDIQFRGDLMVGTISRNGIDIFTGTLAYKQQKDEIESLSEYMDFATNINLKAVNHIDGKPAIRQLTSRKLANVRVTECWSGPCTVELRPNAQAPLFRLPVIEMLQGFYWKGDFDLVEGEIIYDYLENEK